MVEVESRPSGRDGTESIFCTERKHRDLASDRTIFYGQRRELQSLVADVRVNIPTGRSYWFQVTFRSLPCFNFETFLSVALL